jgi:hypothetical protein
MHGDHPEALGSTFSRQDSVACDPGWTPDLTTDRAGSRMRVRPALATGR